MVSDDVVCDGVVNDAVAGETSSVSVEMPRRAEGAYVTTGDSWR